MGVETRVKFLPRAAERAEREGNVRLAAILRAMAAELRPADGTIITGPSRPLSVP